MNSFDGKVKFLGHVVCEQGVTTDPDKVEAVQNWPVPHNAKDVRKFLPTTAGLSVRSPISLVLGMNCVRKANPSSG